jgi:hypothetical protein
LDNIFPHNRLLGPLLHWRQSAWQALAQKKKIASIQTAPPRMERKEKRHVCEKKENVYIWSTARVLNAFVGTYVCIIAFEDKAERDSRRFSLKCIHMAVQYWQKELL